MSIFEGALNNNIYGGKFVSTIISLGPNKLEKALQDLRLHSALGAFNDSRLRYDPPKCLPRTREAVCRRISGWIQTGSSEKPILWMCGPAGAGKSAIAQTIAEQTGEIGYLLAASFFFWRSDGERNTTERLIPSIAYQLIATLPSIRDAILRAVAGNPQIFSLNCEGQMKKLIMEPLRSAGIVRPVRGPSRVIIIDGLDECNSLNERTEFLTTLINLCSEASFPFGILCSSRPERDIRDTLRTIEAFSVSDCLVLDNFFKPDADIKLFFDHHFAEIKRSHPLSVYIPTNWPARATVETLVQKSSGQFIYASTVVKHVSSKRHRPVQRLEVLMITGASLDASPFVELDAVYRLVLSASEDTTKLLRLLGMVLFTSMTITPGYAERTLGLEEGDALLLLDDIQSLIEVGGPSDPLRLHHASLGDFLTDRHRAGKYYVEAGEAHANLALGTIQILFDGMEPPPDLVPYRADPSSFPADLHFTHAALTEQIFQYFKNIQWERTLEKISPATRDASYTLSSNWLAYVSRMFKFCHRASARSSAWHEVYNKLVLALGEWFQNNLASGQNILHWTERFYFRHLCPRSGTNKPLELWSEITASGPGLKFYKDPRDFLLAFHNVVYDVLRNRKASGPLYIGRKAHNRIIAREVVDRIEYFDGSVNFERDRLPTHLPRLHGISLMPTARRNIAQLLQAAHRTPPFDRLVSRVRTVFITGHSGEDGVEELEEAISGYNQKPRIPPLVPGHWPGSQADYDDWVGSISSDSESEAEEVSNGPPRTELEPQLLIYRVFASLRGLWL